MARHITIRTDSTPEAGVGHLLRTLAFAEELQRQGHRVSMIGSVGGVAWAERQVVARGLVMHPAADVVGGGDAFVVQLRELGADVVVLDGYQLPATLGSAARSAGIPVMAMVDGRYGLHQPADLYVDPNLGAREPDDLPAGARMLLGLDFVLLRDQVVRRRGMVPAPHVSDPMRVLVVFGGTDPHGGAAAVVDLVRDRWAARTGELGAVHLVVVAGRQDAAESLTGLPPIPGVTIEVHGPVDDLPGLAVTCDAAISAAGSSVWELLCLGVPLGLVCVTDNQELGYRETVAAGVVAGLGHLDHWRADGETTVRPSERARAGDELVSLLGDVDRRTRVQVVGRSLVDGRGRERVAEALFALGPPRPVPPTPRRIRAVLQSRLSSSRLPGKALLPIGGLPMVVLAARRAGHEVVEPVIATSLEPEDDAIASVSEGAGIRCVRGPLHDTLTRFVLATDDLPDDAIVVRLTGDNLLPDEGLVLEMVAAMDATGAAYARAGGDRGNTPLGLSVEVMTVGLLRTADQQATSAYDREHVTTWMRQHHENWVAVSGAKPEWRGRRGTVDTLDDFDVMRRVFDRVDDPVRVSWRDLCEMLPPPPQLGVRRPNPLDQAALVLGTVQIGLDYGVANTGGLPTEQTARALLTAAADLGVTHFDTAREYGLSEERIGLAMRRGLSERVGVVTKIRPLEVPRDAPVEWARAAVDLSVSESLRALQTSRLGAVLLHRAEDRLAGGGAVIDRLKELREQGVVDVLGASVTTPAELLGVLAEPWCGYVQLPFNLLDHRWLAADVQSALAARPEVIVTVRSVYLQGLLASGDATVWPAVPGMTTERVHSISGALAAMVGDFGRSGIRDLAMAYVLAHPWVTSVVVGADNADQLRENVALIVGDPLTAEQCRQASAVLHRVPEDLLDPALWPVPGGGETA